MAAHLWLSVALTALAAHPLRAAAVELSGTVVGQDGAGVEAVVWVDAPPESARRALPPLVITQRSKAFVPRVAAAEVGQTVKFPNEDSVFHNVFSASKGNAFDLGLYKNDGRYDEKSKMKVQGAADVGERVFTTPGRVDLFCNIHPEMSAALVILPHPYHAATDARGAFRLAGPKKLAPGARLHALDAFGNEASVPAADGAKIAFSARKTETPDHQRKDGHNYPVQFDTTY